MRRLRLRDDVQHPLQIIGLTVLAAVVVVGAVVTIKSAAPEVDASTASPALSLAAGASEPGALFVGGSEAAGVGLKQGQAASFACRTALLLGWSCTLDAEAGTGYLADGHTVDGTYGPYASRLAGLAATYQPHYVVITGGRSDPGGDATDAAAKAYILDVARAFPQAKVIVVAPFWNNLEPPGTLLSLRDTLKAAAQTVNATFIDPLANGWAVPAADLQANKVDLNASGQALLAKLLSDAIIDAGLTPSATSPSAS